MGRQQRHGRTETLEKAMNLFWRNGFSGTSLRDLEEWLDMRPGSIYSRFGNKERLYAEAMSFYAAESFAVFRSHMEKAQDFMSGLRHFIEQLIFTPSAPRCCMLAKTLIQTTDENTALKKMAGRMIADFEDHLAGHLQKAIKSGEVNNYCDPHSVARFIQIQIIGLRSYAEMEIDDRLLTELLDDVMAAIAAKITEAGITED